MATSLGSANRCVDAGHGGQEAGGALTGDKSKKREGRSDQRKAKAKEKKANLKDLLS
jgi:uncharacterized protein YjbJ (UPF0337 family)